MSLELDLKRIREKFRHRADKVAKGTFLSLAGRIVKSTPVGNPELWIYNAGTKNNPRYVDYIAYRGRPEGYIGGTLRGAWNISENSPQTTFTKAPDKTGSKTSKRLKQQTASLTLGNLWWMTNPAPHAARIEYEGWSTQAPAGMLRVNVMETQEVVAEQLKK